MRIRGPLLLASLLIVLGCGDLTGPGRIAGTYDLRSVNGDLLPARIFSDFGIVEVVDGFLRLRSDRTFHSRIVVRSTIDGRTDFDQDDDFGTYDVVNTAIQLNFDDGSTSAGSISGRRVTILEEDFSFVFVR